MKCCCCNKEINIDTHELEDGHAVWFGKYIRNVCLKVICWTCIQDPKKKKEYQKQ